MKTIDYLVVINSPLCPVIFLTGSPRSSVQVSKALRISLPTLIPILEGDVHHPRLNAETVLDPEGADVQGIRPMLSPPRNHLSPKDPKPSLLPCTTEERSFTRVSVDLSRDQPGIGETRWATSEDANVEYLLDIFTSADANSDRDRKSVV